MCKIWQILSPLFVNHHRMLSRSKRPEQISQDYQDLQLKKRVNDK